MIKEIFKVLAIWFFILMPIISFADYSSVINNVSVSSDTGGNVVSEGGSINTGSKSASVKVETTIGGKVVDFFEEVFSDGDVEDESIEIEFSTTTDNTNVESYIKVDVGGINAKSLVNTPDDIPADFNKDIKKDILTKVKSEKVEVKISATSTNAIASTSAKTSPVKKATLFNKIWKYVFSIFTI